jgi:hypothetical protein
MASVDLGQNVKNPTPVEPTMSIASGMIGKLRRRDHLPRVSDFCFGRVLNLTMVAKRVAPQVVIFNRPTVPVNYWSG